MAPHTEDVKIPLQSLQEPVYNSTTQEFFEDRNVGGKQKARDSAWLYLSAFAVTLSTLGVGTIIVWTSPVVARLQSNNTDENPLGIPATTFQVSLLGGMPTFGAIVGCLVLTKLCDHIGRKKTTMVLSTMILLATAGLAIARTINLYYITRFISGLGMGALVPGVSIFLSEISEDHNRATLGCLLALSFPIGNLFAYVIGPYFSIQTFTLLCCIPYMFNLLGLVMFVPESPSYLASKGDRIGAVESLSKLRNKTPSEIEKEYEAILFTLKHGDHSTGGLKAILRDRGLRKGLIISVALICIQQLTGVTAIIAFAAPLFDAAGTGISGHNVGIMIGLTKVFAVFLAIVIIEKSGRRPLLLVSTFGTAVCLFALGLYFYLKSVNSLLIGKIFWLPVLAVILYFVCYGVGIGAIPLSIMSELFPSTVRTTAATFSLITGFICMVCITIAFPVVNKALGETWCLWAFTVCSLIGYIFIYAVVPEIKGKSVLEIQKLLSR